MKQSELFSKTEKNFPKDEEFINAKYLIKGGFIAKNSSGIFSFLPLGWRVLNKINNIIREEMNAIGGQEILMPALVAKRYWDKSGRWDVDMAYKLKAGDEDFALGWTHEEVVASFGESFIHSEKDLPVAVYQIQTKFRHEPRARGGLLRGREFLMKDLYSFHATEEDLKRYYKVVEDAYRKIFDRLSLSYKIAEASGGDFTKDYTHEFQVLTPVGEDIILYCDICNFAQNKEIAKVKAGDVCGACPESDRRGEIQEGSAVEVGNIFKLGNRFSKWFMGSYGIGPSRIMGTLVEIFHDDKGIIWPDSVAPFQIHLISLPGAKNADTLYNNLVREGFEVLYDDREMSAGEKFSDADLLGIPHRLVVSEKAGDGIEHKRRGLPDTKILSYEELLQLLGQKCRN
ncbi:MAG: aminoacyl--tRNA ligase-related protein [Patescibacteria group bacterium]